MDIWEKYKSPFGYEVGNNNGLDSYGVNHNRFSLRDEIEYQMARNEREQKLMNSYDKQGLLKEEYPQYGTNFWGKDKENNYGFGSSNIGENIKKHPAMSNDYAVNLGMTPLNRIAQPDNSANDIETYDSSESEQHKAFNQNQKTVVQTSSWEQQKWNNVENDLLMNGMDTLYGMNRTINGITFGGLDLLGNKLGFDSQMNEYLKLKDMQGQGDITRIAGQFAEFGGGFLSGNKLFEPALNQANMAYNSHKIGKAYDRLKLNPFEGKGIDVIARMKNHNGEQVLLQRGEVICGADGRPIVYGNNLKRATGTNSNYGLDKGIYKHNITKADAQRIPRIIQQKPFKTNKFGQYEYLVDGKNGPLRVVTSPKDSEHIVSTMYYVDR